MIWTLGWGRDHIIEAIRRAPDRCRVELMEPKRSDPQNDKMWAMLGDISEQHLHYGERLPPVRWKLVMVMSTQEEIQLLRTWAGRLFEENPSTSRMSVRQLSDLITYIQMCGDEVGIRWSDPSQRQDDGR